MLLKNKFFPLFFLFLFFTISANTQSLFPYKKDKSYGYIDKSGKVIITPQFDKTYEFIDGLGRVKKGPKIGFVNSDGKIVIPIIYDKPEQVKFHLPANMRMIFLKDLQDYNLVSTNLALLIKPEKWLLSLLTKELMISEKDLPE
jgi:hypothetical protein